MRVIVALLVSAATASSPTRGWAASAETRLVLIGGGTKPDRAMRRFVDWAGGPSARILVVPWASAEAAESASSLREELQRQHPADVTVTPLLPLDDAGRATTLETLRRATGVFFGGGDQGRILDALRDEELLEAFRVRYRAGAVFGGTSAGAAIMSPVMITGEGDFTVLDGARVETRPGLALLPGTIVDQHFVRRQRQNRLFGLVLDRRGDLGVGIDEDTALLVRQGRFGEVVGDGVVMLVDGRREKDALVVRIARAGQRVDLHRRVVVKQGGAPASFSSSALSGRP